MRRSASSFLSLVLQSLFIILALVVDVVHARQKCVDQNCVECGTDDQVVCEDGTPCDSGFYEAFYWPFFTKRCVNLKCGGSGQRMCCPGAERIIMAPAASNNRDFSIYGCSLVTKRNRQMPLSGYWLFLPIDSVTISMRMILHFALYTPQRTKREE
jgi:hypothetical protein